MKKITCVDFTEYIQIVIPEESDDDTEGVLDWFALLRSENSTGIERCAKEIVNTSDFHQQLLNLLFEFAYIICKTYQNASTDTKLSIPLGPFFRRLGIDYHTQRSSEDLIELRQKKFIKIIKPYTVIMPEIDGESYQVMNFAEFDKDEAHIRLPYMIRLAKFILIG